MDPGKMPVQVSRPEIGLQAASVPFFHTEHPERCETRSLSASLLLTNQQITDNQTI
jgi:hypothetical protein